MYATLLSPPFCFVCMCFCPLPILLFVRICFCPNQLFVHICLCPHPFVCLYQLLSTPLGEEIGRRPLLRLSEASQPSARARIKGSLGPEFLVLHILLPRQHQELVYICILIKSFNKMENFCITSDI